MKQLLLASAFGFAAMASVPAHAIINAPVPTENYITFGGLDWAWASPCAPEGGCSSIDLSYQSTQGWRAPTASEWAARPSVPDFGPSDNFACASAWFDIFYTHCDYFDPDYPGSPVAGVQPTGVVWDWGYGTSDYQGFQGLAETWLVRDSLPGGIPEAATWALMLAGFGMVGVAARRRRPLAA
jgi:hypothetical protein